MPLKRAATILAAGLVFTLGSVAGLAATNTASTTTTTTVSTETTTAATTTAATTTTVATTATTTTSSTTTAPTSTTTSRRPKRARHPAAILQASAFPHGCPVAAAALVVPGRTPLALGPVAGAGKALSLRRLAYPASGAIVTGSALSIEGRSCSNPARPARAELRSLRLFGGALSATRVDLAVGRSGAASVVGLVVGGRRANLVDGRRIPLGGWGYLVGGARPVTTALDGRRVVSALAIQLTRAHASLPAQATVLILPAGMPAARAAVSPAGRPRTTHPRPVLHRHRYGPVKPTREPLKMMPPLGERRYVFPVAGGADYGDTYGAFRGDVPGQWHHGDDLFAPLGTPVVAVADGTLNRVGWERLGGWRLWVRDRAGDEFYYAHLSGYAPATLRSGSVRAGQVLGFVGNTGDAFTTTPHLHFEVHPRQLLRLDYDGAVDPTPYLAHWTRLGHVDAPRPTHPPVPSDPVIRREARYVFRELLVARHLVAPTQAPRKRPHVHVPKGQDAQASTQRGTQQDEQPTARSQQAHQSAASRPRGGRSGSGPGSGSLSPVAIGLLAGVAALMLAAAAMLLPPVRRYAHRLQIRPAGSGVGPVGTSEEER